MAYMVPDPSPHLYGVAPCNDGVAECDKATVCYKLHVGASRPCMGSNPILFVQGAASYGGASVRC